MQTIIYLDTLTGYKTLDVRDASMLQRQQDRLTRMGKFVVCVVDPQAKVLIEKCDCYEAHRKFIDSCFHLDQQGKTSSKNYHA